MSPRVAELLSQLTYVREQLQKRQLETDLRDRVGWAIAEIQHLASQQDRALHALRFMSPRVQAESVELALRAAGTRVEADPVYQAMKLQQEDAMSLYHELEKEYAAWKR
jgi:hypothetical protein